MTLHGKSAFARKLTFGCSAMALALAVPALASAQSIADGVRSNQVDEIVVTAQRRAERLEDVPITIASVSGASLENANLGSMTQLNRMVPTLRFDLAGAAVQPTIRGVGTALAGPGASGNVATYIDGIYLPNPSALDMAFLSIQSIDVLKGPQGTLFGRNATGGAILVTTRAPSFTPTATLKGSYGRFNTFNVSGYASGAIIDGVLAADIAAFNEKSDGYLRNIFLNKKTGEYKRYGLRSKILFTPSDWSKFTLTLAQGQTTDNKVRNYNANTQLGPAQATFRPGGLAPSDRGLVSANLPTWFKLTSHSVSLTSEFDLGFADLKSYTGWQYHAAFNNLDRDASNLDIIYSASRVKYRTGQQEFDLSSKPGSKLSWVAGAFFLRDTTYNRETYQKNGAVPVTPNYVYGVTSRSYAGYFDATYQFTEQLFLTGGIRYSHEKLTDYWIDYPGVYGSAPAIYTIPVNSGVTFSSTTPRAVLRYQIDPGTNVYASFSKGFKAGLVNPSAKSTLTIEPEKITAYEIGYKTARSGMRFNASAFMYDYKNLQVSSFTGVSSIITNASNSKIYGVEAQFSGNLTDQLTANLAAAYVHSRYKDFTTAPAFAQNRTTGAFANVVAIASGLQMQRSPIFTASAGLDYKVPLSSGSLTFSGNGYYTSTIYFDPSHQFSQKGYALLGARAVYTTTDGHYSAALYVDNITDTKYLNQVLGGPAVVQQTYGDPRTFGASITLHY